MCVTSVWLFYWLFTTTTGSGKRFTPFRLEANAAAAWIMNTKIGMVGRPSENVSQRVEDKIIVEICIISHLGKCQSRVQEPRCLLLKCKGKWFRELFVSAPILSIWSSLLSSKLGFAQKMLIISVENHFWSSVGPPKATTCRLLQRFFHLRLDTHTEENIKNNIINSKHLLFYYLFVQSCVTDMGPDLPGNNPCGRPPAFVRP